MIEKIPLSDDLLITHSKAVERVLRRAVREALIAHKRAGNTIAVWRDGKVQLIGAENIVIPEIDSGEATN